MTHCAQIKPLWPTGIYGRVADRIADGYTHDHLDRQARASGMDWRTRMLVPGSNSRTIEAREVQLHDEL